MNNSAGAIIYQEEVNMYYKNHVERIRMDICDLRRTEMILGMPQLQVHNPEINWETEEVKITRCPPLYGRNTKKKEDRKTEKGRRIATIEEKKIGRWAVDGKEDQRREEKVEVDYRKIKEIVSKRFLK